jgi:hypothetical protein
MQGATMTQLDRQQSAEPEEGVIEYEGHILGQMRFVEDTVNKFEIQNYAACGAVLLAHFTNNKIPSWIIVVIVAVLNVTFAIAITVQIERLKKLFVMHCIVRTHWLGGHPDLSRKLSGNKISREVVEMHTLPRAVFNALLIAQFIPVVGALILLNYSL